MPSVKLSVVIELDTKDISGKCDYLHNLKEWIQQLEAVAPERTELILCSSSENVPDLQISSFVKIRMLALPGVHYYGLKNCGANAAAGEIVAFSDSDCRPGKGYVEALLKTFKDSDVQCAYGRSFYDGNGILASINTTFSFGFTHGNGEIKPPLSPLTHNVALRRTLYQKDPFGPYNARVGGDNHLAIQLRMMRCRIAYCAEMVTYHEDPSWSIRPILERHLREHFAVLSHTFARSRPSSWHVLRQAFIMPTWRFRTIRRWGSAVGVRSTSLPIILLLLGSYFVMDLLAILVVFAVPSLKQKYYEYLFGQPLASELLRTV